MALTESENLVSALYIYRRRRGYWPPAVGELLWLPPSLCFSARGGPLPILKVYSCLRQRGSFGCRRVYMPLLGDLVPRAGGPSPCFRAFWAEHPKFTGFSGNRLRRASMPVWSLVRHPASRCLQSWRKSRRPQRRLYIRKTVLFSWCAYPSVGTTHQKAHINIIQPPREALIKPGL
jgi:hypothetical protein